MHAVFLAVIELNSGKSFCVWVFIDLRQWPMAWPYGQAEEQWKPSLLKGCTDSPVEITVRI